MKAAISPSCAEAPPALPPGALPRQVHVIGASGRSGQALTRALLAAGSAVVPVIRSAERWRATGLPGDGRLAELADAEALRASLHDATAVVSCAHARTAPAVLAALALAGAMPAVAAPLAALLAGIGLFAERWLFFAEATHVSAIYYGRAV